MAFVRTDVGLVLEIKVKADEHEATVTTKKNYILQAEYSSSSGDFPLGIFPTRLMVLLIAAKNKLKRLKIKGISDTATISDVTLKGLILPAGTKTDYKGHLTYSTLPFVYICNNELGKAGLNIPLYEFPGTGDTLKCQKAITLNRDSGNFYLQDNVSTLDVSDYSADKISKTVFADLLVQYNGDFINSGVDEGNLFAQLSNRNRFGLSVPFKNNVFADVLNEVASRWLDNSGLIKDYNIGASLYVANDRGHGTTFKPLMTSLNIKSVNKAAHAEVRIALLLDFLTKYGKSSGHLSVDPPLTVWTADIILASNALKSIIAPSLGTSQLGLFSSLLPCYMCLGNVESTVGGYIKSINGQPVGMQATFEDVSETALIVDTDYYDVDSAIEYRKINIYKDTESPSGLIASVDQINVSEPLVSNVKLSLAIDNAITPFPVSVSNAGSDLLGVGLQNQTSMLRYTLAASTLQLVHTKTAKQVIDDSTGVSATASGGQLGVTHVHSYLA